MMSLSKIRFYLAGLIFWFLPLTLLAVDIHRVPGVPIRNDILISPAKVEISSDPGVKLDRYINVQNRTGKEMIFKVSVEDFSPSTDPSGSVILNKTIDGLNSSLKKYVTIDSAPFMLSQGDQARVPVKITLPKNIGPGGLYAAVIISGTAAKNEPGAAKVVTRLGSLFFVKVNGNVKQSGILKEFSIDNNKFSIAFENNGDIYLNPYGEINIYDKSDNLIDKIPLDPWFVLPRSTKIRAADINGLKSGSYTAKLSINRGYDNVIDSKNLSFEYSAAAIAGGSMPMWIVIPGLVVLLILLYKIFL